MDILTTDQIKAIQINYPELPKDYILWLSENGWGEIENGYMIYSSPTLATDIFGTECDDNIKDIILIGDDMAGYSIGFKVIGNKCFFVGADSCNWEVEEINESFSEYVKS